MRSSFKRFFRRRSSSGKRSQSQSSSGAVSPVISQEPKQVFAHFIVGNAAHMTADEWKSDITLAQKAHIDGFALNIAPQDSYTDDVLNTAYEVASEIGNFTMFLSFDYLSGGPWPVDRVIETINAYKDSPAQTIYQDKPLVSTFEGVNNVQDWPIIKADADCFLVPSWTSMGPAGFKEVLDIVDGAFSWDAWAEGAQLKTADSDRDWMNAVGDKAYMMPIAPWFYTDLPQWEKNWLWRGDDLWYERWQQAIELQPEMIEIITWNDFGEASYIGPIRESGIPEGAGDYVKGNPHDAWRALLPQFIDAYKSGNKTMWDITMPETKNGVTCDDCADKPQIASSSMDNSRDSGEQDVITFWYRRTPSYAGQTGGTTGNNPAQGQQELPPGEVSEDKIFLSILVAAPSDISIAIGETEPTTRRAKTSGVNHFSVPFDNRCGPVKITVLRDGNEVVSTDGPAITEETTNGKVNWNAFVGSSLVDNLGIET